MSARDVIAKSRIDVWGETGESAADVILRDLTAAGYRILGPDDLDPVTVEKCAEVALGFDGQTDYDLEPEVAVAESVTSKGIAATIRSLGEGR